jgi:hypothetical protein
MRNSRQQAGTFAESVSTFAIPVGDAVSTPAHPYDIAASGIPGLDQNDRYHSGCRL